MTDTPTKPTKVSTGRKNGERYQSEADSVIARRLNFRRVELGLTQKKLASLVNLTPQQIAKYELGENRLSAGVLFTLAEALKVTPNYFYTGTRPETDDVAEPQTLIQARTLMTKSGGAKLIEDLSKMPAPRRQIVAALVRQLADELKDKKP